MFIIWYLQKTMVDVKYFVLSGISRGRVRNLKIPVVFSKMFILLVFLIFWNGPFTIHRKTGEGRRYLYSSSCGTKILGQIIYGEVILNGRTNDQTMLRWGRSLINDTCIFQYSSNLNTVNLH